jgi:hypothetical protein
MIAAMKWVEDWHQEMKTLREYAKVYLMYTSVSTSVLSYRDFKTTYADEIALHIMFVNAAFNSFPVEVGSVYPAFIQIRMHPLPEVKDIGDCINEFRKAVCQLIFLVARTHEHRADLPIASTSVYLSTCIAFCATLDKQNTLFFMKDAKGKTGLIWVTDEELAQWTAEWKQDAIKYLSPPPFTEMQSGTIDKHYAMLLKHGNYVCKEAFFDSCNPE